MNEDKKFLRLNKIEVIKCRYWKGSGRKDPKYKDSITPLTFKRRVYNLIDDLKYVFIHYLDEKKLFPAEICH